MVRHMLGQGATAEDVLQSAMNLSREAYHKLTNIEKLLDQAFGSQKFRKETIEPLLKKERELEAIKSRASRGEQIRTSDRDNNLKALLRRRQREYAKLQADFPWFRLELDSRRLVKSYLKERREHLLFGDVELVRNICLQEAAQTALAS